MKISVLRNETKIEQNFLLYREDNLLPVQEKWTDTEKIGAVGGIKDWITRELSVSVFDMQFVEDITYLYTEKEHYIYMYFVTNGEIRGRQKNGEEFYVGKNEHILFNWPKKHTENHWKKGVHTEGIMIRMRPSNIQEKLADFEEPEVKAFIDHIETSGPISSKSGKISSQMRQIVQEIRTTDRKGQYLRIFLEAKCLELLLLQIEYFAARRNPEKAVSYMPANEFDKLVRLLQNTNYGDLSREQVAKRFGVSQYHLEKDVQAASGRTFAMFWKRLKMEYARDGLAAGTLNIKQATAYTGFCHSQHFSTAFKKEFGISPSKLKIRRKD